VEWYKVRLMHDGHYWMVQDLKFGNKCYKTGFFGSYDSDQTGKITWLTDETYYGDCRNNPERNAGYLYDWAAAMQRTGAYFNGPEVGCSGIGSKANLCQGICPKGWHIPTGGRSGEFYALHTVAGRNCPGINDYCWNSWSEWEGVLGGLCEAFGPVKYNGLTAYYWSSTYGNSSRAYGLSFGGNPTLPGISALDKSYGYSVRCVRNYVL
jgi:uncharacterized protein (TIGR02145 family)